MLTTTPTPPPTPPSSDPKTPCSVRFVYTWCLPAQFQTTQSKPDSLPKQAAACQGIDGIVYKEYICDLSAGQWGVSKLCHWMCIFWCQDCAPAYTQWNIGYSLVFNIGDVSVITLYLVYHPCLSVLGSYVCVVINLWADILGDIQN